MFFWSIMTLTSGLSPGIIVSGVYPILFGVGVTNLVCGCILGV